jgi:TPR repeat protein
MKKFISMLLCALAACGAWGEVNAQTNDPGKSLSESGYEAFNNQNYEQALSYFKRAAGQNDPDGQYMVGLFHYSAMGGVPRNYAEAVKWFRLASDNGHWEAPYYLGNIYFYGYGVDRNYAEALKWYNIAAKERGNTFAWAQIGLYLELGLVSDPEPENAVVCYRQGAQEGDDVAQARLGNCYMRGFGVARDYAEATRWNREAAEAGNSQAQTNLGWQYETGAGVAKDLDEAVRLYRLGAEGGNTWAQNRLGLHYFKAEHRDLAESVKWFRLAADQGYAPAQSNLAFRYLRGWGVPMDNAEVVKWYRKAAEQGDAAGQNGLGDCYHYGWGVEKDYAEAGKWYKMAAAQGYTHAYESLGNLYHDTLHDYPESVKWYTMAAEAGSGFARSKLEYARQRANTAAGAAQNQSARTAVSGQTATQTIPDSKRIDITKFEWWFALWTGMVFYPDGTCRYFEPDFDDESGDLTGSYELDGRYTYDPATGKGAILLEGDQANLAFEVVADPETVAKIRIYRFYDEPDGSGSYDAWLSRGNPI